MVMELEGGGVRGIRGRGSEERPFNIYITLKREKFLQKFG
jgi:hypothetical protein